MSQTTVKTENRYTSTLTSQGRVLAVASSTNRKNAMRMCLLIYQKLNQGAKVL